MATKFTNAANTTLATDITSGATSITVSNGSEFPTVTTASGDYFYATIFQLSGSVEINVEIVKVTDSGTGGVNAVWTVTRGQDGTTGIAHQSASGGTMYVELRWVAKNAVDMLQSGNNLSELTATASTARTNLGLGTIATQAANSVAITGGSITGITDLGVADGGTGASTFTAGFVKSSGGTTALTTASSVALGSEVSGTLGLTNGGTGATTKTAAFNALTPMTTLGDIEYHDGTNGVRLAGNTTTTKKFLRQTGTGAAAAAPAWDTLVDGDVPSALTGKTYNGLTLTAAATGFTVAGGTTSKTLTMSNTLTFTGTDSSSVAFGTGGTVAYTGGKLNQFAATTSSELAGVISDETGSGALVFANTPSLTTPALSGETFSTSATVTAGTNAQGQGALTSDYNVITTAANNPSGVTLPTATVGRRIVVVNKGANSVNVYPATGAAIDAVAANGAVSLPVNAGIEFNASSTTQWYSSNGSVAPVVSGLSTGVLKVTTGTGALSTAVAGTDYQAPIGTISGIAKGNGANALTAAVAGTDYQSPIGTISGIAKGNGANALTAATAGTDYAAPGTASTWTTTQTYNNSTVRLLGSSTGYTTLTSANASATNYTLTLPAANTLALISSYHHTISGPTAARTYTFPDANSTLVASGGALGTPSSGTLSSCSGLPLTGVTSTLNGLIKCNGASSFSAAASGTDYAPATSGTGILKGNGSGGFSTASAGTDYPGLATANSFSQDQTFTGSLGVGSSPVADAKVGMGGTLPASAGVSLGSAARGSFPSGATLLAISYLSQPSTVDAAFTVASLSHFHAAQGTITGGTRTVPTAQYGYVAASSLTGATNNFGFYSDIASGTGRWNFYASGTASNYFGGQVVLDKGVTDKVFTITDAAAFEIDPANGAIQTVTLGAARTPAATNFAAGQSVLLGIDDGTAYTITWTTVNPTWVKAGGSGAAPTLATTGYTWVLLWKVGSTIYAANVGSP